MATTIVMPQMGYDMREGTVVKWYKNEGEQVDRGEIIADIQTDKATVEFEAYVGGVLGKIYAAEGVAIPVGETIAVITEPGEDVPVEENESVTSSVESSETLSTSEPDKDNADSSSIPGSENSTPVSSLSTEEHASPVEGVRASPLARRLAKERGIDLSTVNGSGPGGRIVEKDIDGYNGAPVVVASGINITQADAVTTEPLSSMRQAIARVTVGSKTTAPHFYVTSEIDMLKAVAFRQEINDVLTDGTRVSINDLIIKAAALALKKFPKFNAFFKDNTLEFHSSMNIGIAIALPSGLMVPGINNCELRTLSDIAKASSDLISRANEDNLTNEEYTATTFSISNLGMFDVESFSAIIFPPHAAVLAVGSVKDQPVVRNGELGISKIMKATLSVDHRVADGAEAAEFLVEIKSLLESPVLLVV
ncbi:MAG: dihydrolipoamide acetyltransferase family protein [Dehalococcoidia bacterium]